MVEYVKEAELRIMNLFWKYKECTRNEIAEHCAKLKYPYTDTYIFNVVRQLEKRNFIKSCSLRAGVTRCSIVYKPTFTKAEFCFYLLNPNEQDAKELVSLCNDLLTNRTWWFNPILLFNKWQKHNSLCGAVVPLHYALISEVIYEYNLSYYDNCFTDFYNNFTLQHHWNIQKNKICR